MRKTFKKITAAVMAAATLAVGSVGMTASAANHSFWFSLGDKGGHQLFLVFRYAHYHFRLQVKMKL